MGTCPGPLKQTAGADNHSPVFRYRARPALVVCVNWVRRLCSWFVPPLADLYRCCPAWGLPAFGSAPNNPQPRQHRSVWVGAVHDFVYTDNPQQASACMSVRPGRRCGAVTGWAHGVSRWRCQPLPAAARLAAVWPMLLVSVTRQGPPPHRATKSPLVTLAGAGTLPQVTALDWFVPLVGKSKVKALPLPAVVQTSESSERCVATL